ncbi:RcnB family protein [Frateuria defendens]|uniref:RcnB family protein n=1 Tax=Frateuria defendens TaxID=2219559 RepID=UPI00066FC1F3|nr:RcnB family protein [Frateuria defendens]
MKKQLGTLFVCAAMLASSPALLAQSHGQGHGHGNDNGYDDDQDRGHGHGHGHDKDRGYDRDDHGHGPPGVVYRGFHDRGRHEGWYKRGGRVPPEFLGPRYVVTDWRYAHLREPPRGYHWIRSDNGDFLMVAIATGIIVDILTQ